MALSEENIIKIAMILDKTPLNISERIVFVGTRLTAAVQAAIEAEIARWDAGAGTNFTSIEPKERNFGARISPGSAKSDIQSNIAVLLEAPDWASGSAQCAFERG